MGQDECDDVVFIGKRDFLGFEVIANTSSLHINFLLLTGSATSNPQVSKEVNSSVAIPQSKNLEYIDCGKSLQGR
jgi:hypothetical protein